MASSSTLLRSSLFCFLLLCAVENLCESAVTTADGDDGGAVSGDGIKQEAGSPDGSPPSIKVEEGEASENPREGEIGPQEEATPGTAAADARGKGDDALRYTPPSHYQIAAHVQTNLHTGRSYFLPADALPASFAHLPFLECGAVGSTTEALPLVSGVFRHSPHAATIPRREEADLVVLDNLGGVDVEGNGTNGLDILNNNIPNDDQYYLANESIGSVGSDDQNESIASDGIEDSDDHPRRPNPPKYVVALSPMEITVGGNGNETQKFDAGDIIFIEDTWWGVWDDDDLGIDDELDPKDGDAEADEESFSGKMKGYIMRASPESQEDLNVLMLTVPNAIHRHWKNAQYTMATLRRKREREAMQKEQQSHEFANDGNAHGFGTARPWWRLPATFLKKHDSGPAPRKPCVLEPDPAFSHPSSSSATLSQHLGDHFSGLLRRSADPHYTFLPSHHRDLLLPVLAQTAAAALGGAVALALMLQLWRVVPSPVAAGFGSACLVASGTMGFVWLGEEVLDQWEAWRERRRMGRMMSEGWGRGGGG